MDKVYHGSGEFENKITKKKKEEIQTIMHRGPRDLAVHIKAHDSSDKYI